MSSLLPAMRPLPRPEKASLLLSFDFDGTLHLPAHCPGVSPEFFHLVTELRRKRGALWAVNTGRSLEHALEGVLDGSFPFMPDFFITREQDIFEVDELGRCVAFGQWNEIGRQVHDRLFMRSASLIDRVRQFVENETRAQFISVEGDPAGLIASSVDEMDLICRKIDPWLQEEPDLAYERNTIYLRFAHRDYNKGTTLVEVAQACGMGAAHCFAIGDGPNDLGMLNPAVAAHLACPGNAADEVKAAVASAGGVVCRSEASLGVIEALAHFFPLGEQDRESIQLTR